MNVQTATNKVLGSIFCYIGKLLYVSGSRDLDASKLGAVIGTSVGFMLVSIALYTWYSISYRDASSPEDRLTIESNKNIVSFALGAVLICTFVVLIVLWALSSRQYWTAVGQGINQMCKNKGFDFDTNLIN